MISQKIGTQELTGFVMIPTKALCATSDTATATSLTMEAFAENRSSLVMPGFLGRPAGIITIWVPFSASLSCSGPVNLEKKKTFWNKVVFNFYLFVI